MSQTVDEAAIEARVGPASFQRGRSYFRNGAISATRRSRATIRARCQGTRDRPYRVEATLGDQGIVSAACDCPVGDGGYCKHVAALLLTWLARPEAFVEVEDSETALARRSKEELLALVKLMLRRAPELEDLLELPLPAAPGQTDAVDAEVYRRQARAAFRHAGYEWGAEAGIAAELATIVEVGDAFAARQEWTNAAAAYAAVTDAVIEVFDGYSDEGGDLIGLVQDCAERLGRCLESLSEPAQRVPVLDALFAMVAGDLELGGIDLGGEAPELLSTRTTAEEWRWLAGRAHDALANSSPSGGRWLREAWGELLLDLEAEELDDERYLAVCRETGRIADLVERLLTLGRPEEAEAAAAQEHDYQPLELAPRFAAHGETVRAERLISERSATSDDPRLAGWLCDHYRREGRLDAALEQAEHIYRQRPDLQGYRSVRELAMELGRWQALRPQLEQRATGYAAASLTIQIHLEEGEVEQALAALRRAEPWTRAGMALAVARAAEAEYAADAIEIYAHEAERLIAQRGRENYVAACGLLQRVRDLYARLGLGGTWLQFIADLRERNRALRALREELDRAGL